MTSFYYTNPSDDKWDWLKQQDLLAENKRLPKALEEIEERSRKKHRKNPVVDIPPEGHDDDTKKPRIDKKSGKFNAKVPEECFMSDYTESDLKTIIDEQNNIIRYLKKYGYSKHVANRILLIFDDMVGSELFNNSKKNPFKMLNANHRHKSMTLWMITQAYTEIPKTVSLFRCITSAGKTVCKSTALPGHKICTNLARIYTH